jgi:hypothetical protein
MDRAPVNKRDFLPGFSQPVFKTGQNAYAWNTFPGSSGVPTGPVAINLSAGTITSILEINAQMIWMIGADFVDDDWYAIAYHPDNSGLFIIDEYTGEAILAGSMGYSMTGLAWDPTADVLYASGIIEESSYLFTVDLQSGSASPIGLITDGTIIGIAADANGNIFGINLNDGGLYDINPKNGHGTLIGLLGLEINYAQDIACDRTNNLLYGTLYEATEEIGGFYQINTETGEATLIHQFIAELAGFAIPYSLAGNQAPAAIDDITALAGSMGQLEANIQWTNPSATYGGYPLDQLNSVVLERDGEPIHTINNPQIGAPASYLDQDIAEPGIYTYLVYGINEAGAGPKKAYSVYIGLDVPAAPELLTLTAVGNDGLISWDPPEQGLHGGYCGTNISYSITRFPDNVLLIEDLTDTEFLDTTVPEMGNYFYSVTAANEMGAGGFATSDYALLASGNVIFYEPFQYPAGQLPPGWTLNGTQHTWTLTESQMAGGNPPELCLSYSMAMGNSRLVSSPIPTNGHQYLNLSFKQYLINYEAINNENIGFDVSFDGGTSWEQIWAMDLGIANIHQDEYSYSITVPQEAEQFQLAIRFDGLSYVINLWLIDDIIIKPAPENDLLALSLSGNTTPVIGTESVYTFDLTNAGSLSQNDYSVNLVSGDGSILASLDGDPIAFGERISYQIPWTPTDDTKENLSIFGSIVFDDDDHQENNQTEGLQLTIQAADIIIVSIGNESEPLKFQPYNFFNYHSLTQNLYYPEEIGLNGGIISGIKYVSYFDEQTDDVPLQIWIGETDAGDLSEGWVEPSIMSRVFDGLMSFQKGENELFIQFSEPYLYGGENLVIYSHKTYDEYHLLGRAFYNSRTPGVWRSRIAENDDEGFNPDNLPPYSYNSEYHPNISFLFSTSEMGSLEGMITSNGEPLSEVTVQIADFSISTTSDQNGYYAFPMIQAGTYELIFSKHGYFDFIVEDVVVEEFESTTVNASLEAIPLVTITGKVAGMDNPENGISGAFVSLKGYEDYAVSSADDGHFLIHDVFAQNTYTIKILAQGYASVVQSIVVEESDLNTGTFILQPIAFPVSNVTAELLPGGVKVQWTPPAGESLLKLFQHDGALPEIPDALYQYHDLMYGTVFDLSDFPDARLSHLDFHHLQWGAPMDSYQYMIHLVDFENYAILASYGPFSTQNNDDWESEILPGDFDASGVNLLGVFIQAQGGSPSDAYPCLTADGTPDGFSVLAPVNDPAAFELTGDIGDFLINLWIYSGYGLKEPLKAKTFYANNSSLLKSRRGTSLSGHIASLSQQFEKLNRTDKAVQNYWVYRLKPEALDEAGQWQELTNSTADTLFFDPAWNGLEPSLWQYAVVAEYAAEAFSQPAFSNALEKTGGHQITFRVNMENVEGFNPDNDKVFMAGIFNWDTPGDDPLNQQMQPSDDNPVIFTKSLWLEEDGYEYKYFLNPGWDGAEWTSENNRSLTVSGPQIINDVFGVPDNVHVPQHSNKQIIVFPNPANNHLTIQSPVALEEVRITDIFGRPVYQQSVFQRETSIDVSNLPQGMYIVQTLSSEGVTATKIRIIR